MSIVIIFNSFQSYFFPLFYFEFSFVVIFFTTKALKGFSEVHKGLVRLYKLLSFIFYLLSFILIHIEDLFQRNCYRRVIRICFHYICHKFPPPFNQVGISKIL